MRPRRFDLIIAVQFQNLFRAKFHTDAATLAPVPIDMVLL
jgi:hypothetical protein